ncbi:MAG: hypothetical protein LBJ73_04180 [Rickettsiales bacterium]|jgi:hypothetical protein|nr:hypothetical protein [Rickettsiales bacterium]
MVNIKENLKKAATKIKKAAVIGGIGAASFLPMKGAAQTDNKIELEKFEQTILFDTIRANISEIKNTSALSLNLYFADENDINNTYPLARDIDYAGAFFKAHPGTVKKENNKYIINTDALWEKYYDLGKKVSGNSDLLKHEKNDLYVELSISGQFASVNITTKKKDKDKDYIKKVLLSYLYNNAAKKFIIVIEGQIPGNEAVDNIDFASVILNGNSGVTEGKVNAYVCFRGYLGGYVELTFDRDGNFISHGNIENDGLFIYRSDKSDYEKVSDKERKEFIENSIINNVIIEKRIASNKKTTEMLKKFQEKPR